MQILSIFKPKQNHTYVDVTQKDILKKDCPCSTTFIDFFFQKNDQISTGIFSRLEK